MKAAVKMAMKAWEWGYGFVGGIQASIRDAVGRWRTNAAIKKAVGRGWIHVSELENVASRVFSCLPDSLESGNDFFPVPPEFYRNPDSFLRNQTGGYGQTRSDGYGHPWILLCLAEDWTTDCWGLYKDLGAHAPKVFFAKQDGTWRVDPNGKWRNSLQPVEFEHMSEFALKVRAGFPNQAAVGWDDI